jgi:hypothetical protein
VSATSSHALAERRRAIRGRLEAQRQAIGAAWSYFDAAAGVSEERARRAIVWTRRIAGVAIVVSALRALRRPPRPGLVGRTMGAMAALQKLSKFGRLTGWTTAPPRRSRPTQAWRLGL